MTRFLPLPIASQGLAALESPWPILAGVAAALVCGFVLWLFIGRGPRRARRYRRAQKLLRLGKWEDALSLIQTLRKARRLSKFWDGRLRNAEGECRRAAGIEAVEAKAYEEGLEHHLNAATHLNVSASEIRASVIEKMLAEARALFAASAGPGTADVLAVLDRALKLEPASVEGWFWQGLCHLRDGKLEEARQSLENAREVEVAEVAKNNGKSRGFIDPPLYLAGLLLKLGHFKEAVRAASDANRIDGNCPVVALQLGIAMVTAGVEGSIATRPLLRALGEGNVPTLFKSPAKLWFDGLPEDRSLIRKLSAKHRFVCPLWGTDGRALVNQGRLALGQAYYKMGQFQPAADAFQKVLDDNAPTHDTLRWLGLALTRLERYHEAFKHLKTALEWEDPQDRLTAGCLALCAARGKPDKPDDKGPNVAWAVRTVQQFQGLGDREWVGVVLGVFDDARLLDMALSAQDHEFLCAHLVSIQATDSAAAAAYHQLAAEYPEALKPDYAWLYCRAALVHNLAHEQSLRLYARTFQTADAAKAYYTEHNWDFEELEYAFLKQAAIEAPGAFPAALGPDYASHGEAMLLHRSERLESEDKLDPALAAADVWLRLAPKSGRAYDRLAKLYCRRGKLDRSAELLRSWCEAEPASAVPWARLAVVQHQQGFNEQAFQSLDAAMQRASGKTKADLGCLAARLALQGGLADKGIDFAPGAAEKARSYLLQSLECSPGHTDALWLSAAERATTGDAAGLAALSPAMRHNGANDARFSYFAAVSHLAASDYPAAFEAATEASASPGLKVEAAYLLGWTSIYRHDPEAAASAMQVVADSPASPSCPFARAILGGIRFHQGGADEAVQWWQALDADRRTALGLAEPLQQSLFLDGLTALDSGRFEHASERFREAGKAGLRDRCLGGLIQYALIKAGQRLLYAKGSA
jgi:tetratricopeptide (TPR) repeat protein